MMKTPRLIVKKHRIRIIAEGRVEYEQHKDQEKQQKQAEREAEMARRAR